MQQYSHGAVYCVYYDIDGFSAFDIAAAPLNGVARADMRQLLLYSVDVVVEEKLSLLDLNGVADGEIVFVGSLKLENKLAVKRAEACLTAVGRLTPHKPYRPIGAYISAAGGERKQEGKSD